MATFLIQLSNLPGNLMVYYAVAKICWHNFKHNRLMIPGLNREDFWEISESIIGKFSNIIDTGLVLIPGNKYIYSGEITVDLMFPLVASILIKRRFLE